MKKKILFICFLILYSISVYSQPISQYLYGQNHWLAQGDEGRAGYLNLLWKKVEQSGVKLIRIGGNGYEISFPDYKRLGDMIDSVRKIGAEVILQVPHQFTAAQAKELITFVNIKSKKNIKFWSIGNEPLLHKTLKIEEVAAYIKVISRALKAIDPSIKIFVFDECTLMEQEYADLCGGRLDVTGKNDNGQWLIDGFSFHNYPNGEKFNRDNVIFSGPNSIRTQAKKLVELMKLADKKNNREDEDKLLWALTETNVTWANPDREIGGCGNPSFLGGQFIAEVTGIGMEYNAFCVAPWCINETDHVSSDFGYIGSATDFFPRSSYYHIQLMSQNMKGSYIQSSTNYSYVKTIATKSDDEICLMLMNQDNLRDLTFEIFLNNKVGISNNQLKVSVDAGIEKTLTGSIPNQTTLLFIFNRNGKITMQFVYNINMNLKNKTPEIVPLN